MKLRNLSLTLVFITVLVLILSIQTVYASSLSAFYLSGGVYPPADYTIWREGTYYYAKNAYGAIIYSGTNASEIINSAINSLNAIGGEIYVYADSYAISSPIRFEGCHNIILRGGGVSTTFFASADVNVIEVMGTEEETITNIYLTDFKVQGYLDSNASTTSTGIKVQYTTNTKIVGVWVHKADHGIYLYGQNNYRAFIQDCRCWDNDDDGIADTGGYASFIVNNWCFSNGDCGIQLVNGGNRLISGNFLSGNGIGGGDSKHGLALENVEKSTVDGNILATNEKDGIRLTTNSTRNTISNNIIRDNKEAGIMILGEYTTHNVITANRLISNGNASEANRDGICIIADADNNIITFNTISDSGYWGIYLASTVDYTICSLNNCRDESQGIKDNGSTNKINLCWNGTTWIS